MISYRRRGLLRVAEAWYTADAVLPSSDIVHYRACPNPVEGGEPFPTIWIDLNEPESRLLSEMNKSTRYDVRKAAEYGLRYDFWNADAASRIDDFIEFYDASLAVAKGLPRADPFGLRTYAAASVLDLSRVSDGDSNPLVWHAYYRGPAEVQLTHSASMLRARQDANYRTFLGRANRWGHWEDMKRFKSDGVRTYDFGGWYPGTDDKGLLGVNAFKEGFGGRIVKTWVGTRAASPLGRLYLWCGRLRRRQAK